MNGVGVGINSPIKSIEELIAAGKQRQVTYGSNNVTNVVAMFQLAKLTGARRCMVIEDEPDPQVRVYDTLAETESAAMSLKRAIQPSVLAALLVGCGGGNDDGTPEEVNCADEPRADTYVANMTKAGKNGAVKIGYCGFA